MTTQTIPQSQFSQLYDTLVLHLTQLVSELKQLGDRCRKDIYQEQVNHTIVCDSRQIAALILADPICGGINLTLFLSPQGDLQLSIVDDDLVSLAHLEITAYSLTVAPVLAKIPDVPVWNDSVLPALLQAVQPCWQETTTTPEEGERHYDSVRDLRFRAQPAETR